MNRILAILKLVRWVNLLIIVLSMYLFQYCVIRLYLNAANIMPTMSALNFFLLVLSTVLIAAAGNVVNAYFDYEQDMEHKPESVVIGKYISMDSAFALQMGLNIAGILLGFYLAYSYGNLRLGYIFLSVAALLWMYSMQLKKYFLIGNVVVAVMSALVFVMPVLFEPQLNGVATNEGLELASNDIIINLKCYFLFAFVMSLVREIVKDAEDKDADAAYGMKTLPVVLPRLAVNAIIVSLLVAVIAGLAVLQVYFWHHGLKRHFWFILFLLQFQLLVNVFTGVISKNKADYHNLSVLLKLLMFFGIGSMPFFYWFLQLQLQGK